MLFFFPPSWPIALLFNYKCVLITMGKSSWPRPPFPDRELAFRGRLLASPFSLLVDVVSSNKRLSAETFVQTHLTGEPGI